MNIIVGCHEIANITYQYSHALKELGHNVKTIVFARNKYYMHHTYYDRVFDEEFDAFWPKFLKNIPGITKIKAIFSQIQAFLYLKKNIQSTDLFLFIGGSTSMFHWDLPYIRKYNKKMIFVNCGSDVRSTLAFCQEYNLDLNFWRDILPESDYNKKLRYLRKIEIYADAIFSIPDQSSLALRPYHHLHIPMNISLKPIPKTSDGMKKIVHCPTNRDIKGTKIIEKALDHLREQGLQFSYRRLEGLPHEVLLRNLNESDILIDELYCPGPGVLGLEALSLGVAVCTRHDRNETVHWIPPVLPITTENVQEQVKKLLLDEQLFKNLSVQGPSYVQQFHSPKAIAQRVVDIALAKNQKANFYYPQFYLSKFIPPFPVSDANRKDSDIVLRKYGSLIKNDLQSAKDLKKISRRPDVS